MRMIKDEIKDIREIAGRFKRRDLGGNMGKMIRNSSYQFIQNLVMKVGALAFVIIITRM